MQITVVLWILAVLAYPGTIFLIILFHMPNPEAFYFFMCAPLLTIGVGGWTFMYFVYRIARWASTRDMHACEVRCECGQVNLVPAYELFHAYENIKCEKCGARIKP